MFFLCLVRYFSAFPSTNPFLFVFNLDHRGVSPPRPRVTFVAPSRTTFAALLGSAYICKSSNIFSVSFPFSLPKTYLWFSSSITELLLLLRRGLLLLLYCGLLLVLRRILLLLICHKLPMLLRCVLLMLLCHVLLKLLRRILLLLLRHILLLIFRHEPASVCLPRTLCSSAAECFCCFDVDLLLFLPRTWFCCTVTNLFIIVSLFMFFLCLVRHFFAFSSINPFLFVFNLDHRGASPPRPIATSVAPPGPAYNCKSSNVVSISFVSFPFSLPKTYL